MPVIGELQVASGRRMEWEKAAWRRGRERRGGGGEDGRGGGGEERAKWWRERRKGPEEKGKRKRVREWKLL